MMMTTTQIPWLAWVADEVIAVYQRHVSPRKGFRCAYRALHAGRSSCSQYARRVLQRRGFWGGLAPLLLRRFQRCGDAARLLREQRRVLDYERRKRRDGRPAKLSGQAHDRRRWHWTDACDPTPIDCVEIPCDGGAVDVCPCDGCDLSP